MPTARSGARRWPAVPLLVVALASVVVGFAGGAAASPFDHPTSYVEAPVAGSALTVGTPVTIRGGAANGEAGGIVAVDVSLDGGVSWQPTDLGPGTERWTFPFTPTEPGVVTIVSRAATADVVENPERSYTVTVAAAGPDVGCPCVLRLPDLPGHPAIDDPDNVPVELGLRFRTDRDGSVPGLLFARYWDNVGPHVGHLWTADGELLAEATLGGRQDGFPYLRFDQPVPIEADTTYVVSYYTPTGHYASTEDYFTEPVVQPPFSTVVDEAGGSGGYRYGEGGGFPDQTWHDSNYWVVPVLTTP